MTAIVKFLRYTQQSFSLATGAVLAIHGEISDRLDDRRQRADVARVGADRSDRRDLDAASCRRAAPSTALGEPARRTSRSERAATASTPPAGDIAPRGPRRHRARIARSRSSRISTANFAAGAVDGDHRSVGLGQVDAGARTLVGIWPHTEGEVLLDGAADRRAGTARRSAPRSAICRRTSSSSTARSPRTSRASARSIPRR